MNIDGFIVINKTISVSIIIIIITIRASHVSRRDPCFVLGIGPDSPQAWAAEKEHAHTLHLTTEL